MTTIYLARRATACKGWRWLPGMSLTRSQGARLAYQSDSGRWLVSYGADSLWCDPAPDWLPACDDGRERWTHPRSVRPLAAWETA